MVELRVVTTTGADTVIEKAAIEAFKMSLRGGLLRSGEDGYDEARKVWNGMIDKRPALIARCAGVADVIGAVDFVRTHQLLVSVRGGGATHVDIVGNIQPAMDDTRIAKNAPHQPSRLLPSENAAQFSAVGIADQGPVHPHFMAYPQARALLQKIHAKEGQPYDEHATANDGSPV